MNVLKIGHQIGTDERKVSSDERAENIPLGSENPSEMDELLPDLSDPLQRNVRHLHEDLIFEELDLPRKVLDEREVVVDDGVEERVGDRGGLRPASGILLQRIEEGVNLGDRLIV